MGNADQNPVTLILQGVLSAEERTKCIFVLLSPSDLDTKVCLEL